MPEQILNDDRLMLITRYAPNNTILSVTTSDGFFTTDGDFLPRNHTEFIPRLDQPTVYRYRDSADGSIIDVRILSLEKPESACMCLSAFLAGHWHDPSFGNKETTVSPAPPEVYAQISKLLNPIFSECSFTKVWNRPLLAAEWRDAHPAFMKDLDTVFSSLGLLSVVRHRQSVTQGEASVFCCGREVVRYGDDQWMKHQNGQITNGFREKNGELYGEIIGGWGSALSDEHFRRAALVQFADRIARILVPTKTLTQLIDQAKNQTTHTSAFPCKENLQHER